MAKIKLFSNTSYKLILDTCSGQIDLISSNNTLQYAWCCVTSTNKISQSFNNILNNLNTLSGTYWLFSAMGPHVTLYLFAENGELKVKLHDGENIVLHEFNTDIEQLESIFIELKNVLKT